LFGEKCGLALLQLAQGVSAPRIARILPLTPQAIRKIGHRYQQGGLTRYEQPRPGAAEVLDHSQQQRVIAMVCSRPPAGRARWTVRLIRTSELTVDKVVDFTGLISLGEVLC
jgi:putative transposase